MEHIIRGTEVQVRDETLPGRILAGPYYLVEFGSDIGSSYRQVMILTERITAVPPETVRPDRGAT